MSDNGFTKEELQRAAEELKTTSPEDYLRQEQYIAQLEKNLPEAAVSATFRYVTAPVGWNIQYTMRDFDDEILDMRLVDKLQRLEHEGSIPEGKNVPFPQAAPTATKLAEQPHVEEPAQEELVLTTKGATYEKIESMENIITYRVASIISSVTQGSAIPFLAVLGPEYPYHKFGMKAWKEVWPEGFDIKVLEMGKKTEPPKSMKVAYVDTTNKKVIAFAGSI